MFSEGQGHGMGWPSGERQRPANEFCRIWAKQLKRQAKPWQGGTPKTAKSFFGRLHPPMASQLHYLTVQDILWINLQVTGKVHTFNFAKLEEATYYQYAYGESRSVAPQAARFIQGFPKLHPIEAGNEATIFIAVLAFLTVNGMAVTLTDKEAPAWLENIQTQKTTPLEAIKSIAKHPHTYTHAPDVRTATKQLLSQSQATVRTALSTSPIWSRRRNPTHKYL